MAGGRASLTAVHALPRPANAQSQLTPSLHARDTLSAPTTKRHPLAGMTVSASRLLHSTANQLAQQGGHRFLDEVQPLICSWSVRFWRAALAQAWQALTSGTEHVAQDIGEASASRCACLLAPLMKQDRSIRPCRASEASCSWAGRAILQGSKESSTVLLHMCLGAGSMQISLPNKATASRITAARVSNTAVETIWSAVQKPPRQLSANAAGWTVLALLTVSSLHLCLPACLHLLKGCGTAAPKLAQSLCLAEAPAADLPGAVRTTDCVFTSPVLKA